MRIHHTLLASLKRRVTRLSWKGSAVLLLIAASSFLMTSSHSPLNLHVNRTLSMPQGLYASTLLSQDAPLKRGDRVAIHTPQKAVELGCMDSTSTLLFKEVMGMPGDDICLHKEDGTLWRNNELYSTTAARSKSGERLSDHFAWEGCTTLGPDEYVLATPYARSCDSRYLGMIPRHAISRRVHPLLIK